MTERARHLLDQALELDRAERAHLAEQLLRSLDDTELLTPEAWDDAWSEEAVRRLRELDEGQGRLVPAEEVFTRLRNLLPPHPDNPDPGTLPSHLEAFPIHRESHRKTLVPDFPYALFYRRGPDGIVIAAVAHQKRRPDYWRRRSRT